MNIRHGFIPCAGKGTRMGEVGKHMAKPLWNIFDKRMLDVQCDFLKSFYNIESLIINTYHHANQFKSYKSIKVIEEKTLLGSGGNVHNLKRVCSDINKVIIINPDVNLFLAKDDIKSLIVAFEKYDHVLVCLPVKAGGEYNEVNIQNGFFSHVSGPNSTRDYVSYSGFGMVNLDKIDNVVGESSFFDTVIHKESCCYIFVPKLPFEYWDWGSEKQYVNNIISLSSSDKSSQMYKHLINSGAIIESKLSPYSYHSNNHMAYNFTGDSDFKLSKNTVALKSIDGKTFLIKI